MALAEPAESFWILYGAITRLEAARDLSLLEIAAVGANPGKDGEQARKLVTALRDRAGEPVMRRRNEGKPELPLLPGLTPGVAFEAKPGSIEAERERQKAAEERLKSEWEQRKRQRAGP